MNIDQSRLQRLETLAEKHTMSGEFSSIEWRVGHRDKLVAAGIKGNADAITGDKLPEKPIYRIYSMTKPVVAVIALQLIEEGTLSLATPVAQFFPAAARMQILKDGCKQACKAIMTVEHLLTHRAGFSYDFLPDCEVAELYRSASLAENGGRSLEELTSALLEHPLCFEPGSDWKYSYSIDVLARVLEHASGRTLQELLVERIAEPCGMLDTGFAVPDVNQQRLLPMFGQRRLGDEMMVFVEPQKLLRIDCDVSHPINNSKFVRGGHGLYATAEDYFRFLPVLMSGKTLDGEALISAPMVDMMWCNRIPLEQRPLSIGANILGGYGWNLFGRVMMDPGQALFLTARGEGGWAGAASTYFWVDRETDFYGVVMTQYLGGSVPLGDFFRAAAYQALI